MTAPTTTASHRKPAPPDMRWVGGSMPAAKLGLLLCLNVPLVLLAWDAWHGQLGVNAVNDAIHTTGILAVICLILSLAVTPVRMITGWSWVVQFRRLLGVYAFYYAAVHLGIYFWWDRAGSVGSTVYEITHRYFLMIGFLSLAMMLPLWATSYAGAIRRIGGKAWTKLHRLTYPAAILATIHFYLQSKADKRLPWVFIAILAALLLWRIGAAVYKAWRRALPRP